MAMASLQSSIFILLTILCLSRPSAAFSYKLRPLLVDLFLSDNTNLFSHQAEQQKQPVQQHCGPKLSIETPNCTVLEKRNGYELRQYPDGQMWAETLIANASYREATKTGFYRCYYFISGKNSKHGKIEMTGPVLIKPVPEEKGYIVAFFVPSRFKSATDVPIPLDSSVKITVAKGQVHAVLGPFGGFPNGAVYEKKWQELKKVLERDNMKFDEDTVTYAGYSSPFLYSNRKQEVHVAV